MQSQVITRSDRNKCVFGDGISCLWLLFDADPFVKKHRPLRAFTVCYFLTLQNFKWKVGALFFRLSLFTSRGVDTAVSLVVSGNVAPELFDKYCTFAIAARPRLQRDLLSMRSVMCCMHFKRESVWCPKNTETKA